MKAPSRRVDEPGVVAGVADPARLVRDDRALAQQAVELSVIVECARYQRIARASLGLERCLPGRAAAPCPVAARWTKRKSCARSQADVYLPTKSGSRSVSSGIGSPPDGDEEGAVHDGCRRGRATRACGSPGPAPPGLGAADPARSAFADSLSESTSMSRRSTSRLGALLRPVGQDAEELDRDRELHGRRRREVRGRVPRGAGAGLEVLDVDGRDSPGSRPRARRHACGEARILVRLSATAISSGGRKPEHLLDVRLPELPSASCATTSIVTSRGGRSIRSSNSLPPTRVAAFSFPFTRTTTRYVPAPTVPEMRPERDLAGRGPDDAGGSTWAGSWGASAKAIGILCSRGARGGHLNRAHQAAAEFADDGEELVGVVPTEPSPGRARLPLRVPSGGERTLACGRCGRRGGDRAPLGSARPFPSPRCASWPRRTRAAATSRRLRLRLEEIRLADNPEGIDDAEEAAAALAAASSRSRASRAPPTSTRSARPRHAWSAHWETTARRSRRR